MRYRDWPRLQPGYCFVRWAVWDLRFCFHRPHIHVFADHEDNNQGANLSQCQVPGCQVTVLETVKRKVRICEEHRRALVLEMKGFRGRFCQQCSRVHSLDRFDGNKRGCRDRLMRRVERFVISLNPHIRTLTTLERRKDGKSLWSRRKACERSQMEGNA